MFRPVDGQNRLFLGEFTSSPASQSVAGRIVIPRPTGKKVLKPVRARMPQRLGELQ